MKDLLVAALASLDEHLLRSLQVLVLSIPILQGTGLQSLVTEGQGPGFQQRTLADGTEADRGLFLTLVSRKGHHHIDC